MRTPHWIRADLQADPYSDDTPYEPPSDTPSPASCGLSGGSGRSRSRRSIPNSLSFHKRLLSLCASVCFFSCPLCSLLIYPFPAFVWPLLLWVCPTRVRPPLRFTSQSEGTNSQSEGTNSQSEGTYSQSEGTNSLTLRFTPSEVVGCLMSIKNGLVPTIHFGCVHGIPPERNLVPKRHHLRVRKWKILLISRGIPCTHPKRIVLVRPFLMYI
jgi:hypothetical protein